MELLNGYRVSVKEVARYHGFVFWWTMVAAGTQLSYFCILSLPQLLSLVILYADYLGRNVRGTERTLAASLLQRPTVSSGLCPRHLSLLFSLPSSLFLLRFTHLYKFQCVDPVEVTVCSAGNPLLNYSCSTCNFKGGPLTLPCFRSH